MGATIFGMKKATRLGCWNVRTLNTSGKLKQVVKEMQNYKLEILGLSEVRWKSFGSLTTQDGCFTFLYSGVNKEEDHRDGVGSLLTKKMHKSLKWHPISERILLARFRARIRCVSILQCYAPTEMAKETKKMEFYKQMVETIKKCNKKDMIVIMGDLNAKVGSDNRDAQQVMGCYGTGERNENGDLLVEFCANHALVIGGTLFSHKDCHKNTWISPDVRTENQIDHIIVSGRWKKSLMDVRARRETDVGSVGSTSRRTDTKCWQNVPEMEGVEERWQRVKEIIMEVSENVLGYKNERKKDWMSTRGNLLRSENKQNS